MKIKRHSILSFLTFRSFANRVPKLSMYRLSRLEPMNNSVQDVFRLSKTTASNWLHPDPITTTSLVTKARTTRPFPPVKVFALKTASQFLLSVQRIMLGFNHHVGLSLLATNSSLENLFARRSRTGAIKAADSLYLDKVSLFIGCILIDSVAKNQQSLRKRC